ncbi:MAG: hypothetical protein KAS72_01430 [Phycisphaerales bacterium]|nr:hypothetical protein [Phycisphaerales bacterium]
MSTFLGATHASFDETDWSLICALADSNAQFAEAAQAKLLRDYWAPIFAFIRRMGRSHDDALDMTQEFISRVVLTRGLFQTADRRKGRFRTLVMTAIRNFLTETHRRDTAQKRRPASPLRSLAPGLGIEEPADARTPEAAFDYQLAATVIHRAMHRMRVNCERNGLAVHARLLEQHVIRPILSGGEAPGYDELAKRHGLADARQAANFAAVAKRRFAQELRREVARWVESEHEIDDELARLIRDVGGMRRGGHRGGGEK